MAGPQYPYIPPDDVHGFSEKGATTRRCPYPCCFTCLHNPQNKMSLANREAAMRLAFRTLSDAFGCPAEQQEEWLLGIQQAVRSINLQEREGEGGSELSAARSLVHMWLNCGLLHSLMRVVVSSMRGYIVYLALDILCLFASAQVDLRLCMESETHKLAELLLRVLTLSYATAVPIVKEVAANGGAVVSMGATPLFLCKERALSLLAYLLTRDGVDNGEMLYCEAIMQTVLVYWRGIHPADLTADWSSPDGTFQQHLLMQDGVEAPAEHLGELHASLPAYADRYVEILREKAAIALEAACLSVCENSGSASLWLAACGGDDFLDQLWQYVQSEPCEVFGESYTSTAAAVTLNCLATSGEITSAMLSPTKASLQLLEAVAGKRREDIIAAVELCRREAEESTREAYCVAMRANSTRLSPLSDDILRKICHDLDMKAAHMAHLLLALTTSPSYEKDAAFWQKIAQELLPVLTLDSERAVRELEAMGVRTGREVAIHDVVYEDRTFHLQGVRGRSGLRLTHWTHSLPVSCSVIFYHALWMCEDELLRERLDAVGRAFGESRALQCAFRARVLLEIGVEEDEEQEMEWVQLCWEEPSSSANAGNAALYWAACGQVCCRGLAGTALCSPPNGQKPPQRNLEMARVMCLRQVSILDAVGAIADLLRRLRQALLASCGHCGRGKGSEKLLFCSGCKAVVYCGKACQQKAWKQHKAYCVKDTSQ